jgi:hypothetical protein
MARTQIEVPALYTGMTSEKERQDVNLKRFAKHLG